jgi:glycosyltransferase involved in cell wall biosynthesis
MGKIAVLILTYNEQKNIKECMQSAAFADDMIVIDSGSSDDTVMIAQQLGATVVHHPMTEGFAAQRNFAQLQTTADWILFLDADERITPELAAEIKKKIRVEPGYAYEIPRRNIAFGHWLRYGGWYPDYTLRMYPRTAVSWHGIVHEEARMTIPKRKMSNPLDHYTYTDWNRYFIKFNSYTTLMAKQLHDKGRRASFVDIFFRPWWAFVRTYLLKLGILDGKMGFIMAAFHGFYTMAKYVKLYYLQKE